MWRKTKAVIISGFVFLSIFYVLEISFDITDNASGATIYVNTTGSGGSFTSIQDAIDSSNDGDTVYVFNGTYIENIIVNKMINLYGEDKENTIIDGNTSGHTITVSSDWINISGFSVIHGSGSEGLNLEDVRNCSIRNCNIIDNNHNGIYLYNCSDITISDNIFSGNSYGIYIDFSSFISIVNNGNFSGSLYGIYVTDSDNTTIKNNHAFTDSSNGISVESSKNVMITNNNVSHSREGIYVGYSESYIISNNSAFESSVGINIRDGSGGNIIKNNTLVDNYYGIELQRANGNLVLDNKILSGKRIAIHIDGTKNVILKNNSMTESGILIGSGGLDYWNTHDIDTSNTVNGKPVHYWKNQSGGVIPNGAGQVILASCNNVLVESQNVSLSSVGIQMGYTSDCIIANCTSNENNDYGISLIHSDNNHFYNNTVKSNGNDGMFIYYSSLNTFDSNTASDNGNHGIYLRSSGENIVINNNISGNEEEGLFINTFHSIAPSDNNYIENNTISGNLHGIYVTSKYNAIVGNKISDNIDHGIYLSQSESNTISGNNMTDNGIFIYGNDLIYWNTHTIDFLNTANNKPVYFFKDMDVGVVPQGAGQIILANSDFWKIENQNCSYGSAGVLAGYSHSITISNSSFNGNIFGIYLNRGDNNIISNCTASLNKNSGLYLYFSNGNIIDNSTFNSNDQGIYLLGSDDDIIENNRLISNVKVGINMWSPEKIILYNNTMINCGIFIESYWLKYFITHTIDETNTVNGRPVIYWKNMVGGVVPQNAGQVILANCTDIVIENQEIRNSSCSVELAFVSDITLSNCTFSENGQYGIYTFLADDNIINNNTISDCWAGIRLQDSSLNTLFNNSIIDCYYSIMIFDEFASSENNLLYHNNFIENFYQVTDYTGGKNIWNASYPIGGNYWSDYEGVDNLSGPLQVDPGSDGFGDTPYLQYLDYWFGLDYYPLMAPTRDVLPPRIQLISPGNNSVIQPGVILDFDVYDEGSITVNYSMDHGPEITLHSPYDISTTGWIDGPHSIMIIVRDIHGNITSCKFTITIDSIPPIIHLNSPTNNSLILKGAILNFSIMDPNLEKADYTIGSGDTISLLDPYDIYTDGWIDGEHMVLLIARDAAGNSNSSWYIFSVDSYPPIISLISPLNNSIIIEGEVLSFAILDMNPVQASYSINLGAENPFSEPFNISISGWTDGLYIVHINAQDPLGHENSQWYSFLIDSTPPAIMFTNPGNNSVVSKGTILDFSIGDENLDHVNYSVNGGIRLPLAAPHNISTMEWTNGTYTIQMNAIDLTGNSITSVYFISIDSTSPIIRLNSPVNGSNVIAGTALDFDIFDENPSQVYYSINDGPLLSFSEPFNISTVGWDEGEYTVNINALDTVGNSESSWFFITIDSSPPTISIDPVINHSTIPVGKEIILNISDLEDGEVSYSLDGHEDIDLPLPYIIETDDWSDGSHNIFVTAKDQPGNIATIWFVIIVDAVAPYVVDTFPFNNTMVFGLNSAIEIIFSETMNSHNTDFHISLSHPVPFTISWNHDKSILAISFVNSLDYLTRYTLKIDNEMSDIHGNPMTEDFVFTFTTIPLDSDSDGTPDIIDNDNDNDGYPDEDDAFPFNASEWIDSDDDGLGNNADPDDDNDGHLDENDANHLDPNIWKIIKKSSDVNWLLYMILVIIVIFLIIFFAFIRKRGFKPKKIPETKEEKVEFEVIEEVIPNPLNEKSGFK